ncbi:MAG: hypothetical protein RLZZ480_6 [Candidatus Parcubacteria bacterium]|jgi:general secretion pathway protein G
MSHFFYTAEKKKGFTLVEMVVVITIIGILASILFASFSQSRKISRDKIRKADLKQLQLAIELYKSQNGRYPAGCSADTWVGPGPVSASGFTQCDSNWISGVTPDYIQELPRDPNQESDSNKGFYYKTNSTGSMYKLMVYQTVESLTLSSYSDEFSRCPSACGSCSAVASNVYAVYSAGAECW